MPNADKAPAKVTPEELAAARVEAREVVRTTEVYMGGRRLGTADDAGRLCVTTRSLKGVKGSSYRASIRWGGAPDKAINPATKHPYRHEITGTRLYDLDEVEAWNESDRKAPGSWRHHPENRTARRHEVLTQIAAGRVAPLVEFRVAGQSATRTVFTLDGERPQQTRVLVRLTMDFVRDGMVEVPGLVRRYNDETQEWGAVVEGDASPTLDEPPGETSGEPLEEETSGEVLETAAGASTARRVATLTELGAKTLARWDEEVGGRGR